MRARGGLGMGRRPSRPQSQSIGLNCSSSAPSVQGLDLVLRPSASQSYRTLNSLTWPLRSLQLLATSGPARPQSQSIGLNCSSSAPSVQGLDLVLRPSASQSYRTLNSLTWPLRSLQLLATSGPARPQSQSIGLNCSSSAPSVQGLDLVLRPLASQSYRTLNSLTWPLRSLQLLATSGPARPQSQSIGLTCSSSAPSVQGLDLVLRPLASQSYRTVNSLTWPLRSLQLLATSGPARPQSQSIGLTCSSSAPSVQGLDLVLRPSASQSYRTLNSLTWPLRSLQLLATSGPARPQSQSIGLNCSSSAPSVQGLDLVLRPLASQSYRTLNSLTWPLRSLQLLATSGPARPQSQSIGLNCSSSAPSVQGLDLVLRPLASQSYRTLNSLTWPLRSLQLLATSGPARPQSQSIGLNCSSSAPSVQGLDLVLRPSASQSYRTLNSLTWPLRSLQPLATFRPSRPRSQSTGLTCSSSAPHVHGLGLALRPSGQDRVTRLRGAEWVRRTLAGSYEAAGSMCWAIAPPVFPHWGNGKGERSSRVHKLGGRQSTARATFRTEREHGETCVAERSNGSRAEGPSGSRWGAPLPSPSHERLLTTDASSVGVGPGIADERTPGGAGGSSPVEGEKGFRVGRLGWRRGSVRKCGRMLRSGRKLAFRPEIGNSRCSQGLVAAFIRPGGTNPPCAVWNRRDASARAGRGPVMDDAETCRSALAWPVCCVRRHTRRDLCGASRGGGNRRTLRSSGRWRGAAAKAGEWPLAASCYRFAVGMGWLQPRGDPRTGGIGHISEQDGGMAVLAFEDPGAMLLREVAAGAVGAEVHDVSDLHVERVY